MNENASIAAEKRRIAEQYANGLSDGYADVLGPLPAWFFTHPPAQQTAYQRGWVVGRELALEEAQHHGD